MPRMMNKALRHANMVVIIKGNPEKMIGQEKRAENYYKDIAEYVEDKGYNVVFDDGEPYTCPDLDVAFWIAHSRGTDRIKCIPEEDQWRFLEFGISGGINHPKDEEHQNSIKDHLTNDQQPVKEHFEFTRDQKKAIDDLVKKLSSRMG